MTRDDSKADAELRIIYYRDFIIEYPKTLASLCLFHDEVLLFSEKRLVEERDKLPLTGGSDAKARSRHAAISAFIAGPYRVLSQAGVLRALSYPEMQQEFPAAGQIELRMGHLWEMSRLWTGRPLRFPKTAGIGITRETTLSQAPDAPVKQYVDSNLTVGDLLQVIRPFSVSKAYGIPMCADSAAVAANDLSEPTPFMQALNDELARSALCQLALPDIAGLEPEQVLEVRDSEMNCSITAQVLRNFHGNFGSTYKAATQFE